MRVRADGAVEVEYSDGEAEALPAADVRVLDDGSPAAMSETRVTLSLTNVNEPNAARGGEVVLAENSAAGTAVGAPVQGADVDAGHTASLRYTTSSSSFASSWRKRAR